MNAENRGGIPLRMKEPTVKLPKAVQLQMENVKRLQDAKSEEIKAAVTERFKEQTASGSHAEQTPVAQEAPVTEPEKTEVKPEVKPVVQQTEPNRDAQYWEHRFKTNQGIHEAEKTRFKSTITSLENRLQALERDAQKPVDRVSKELDITKYVGAEDLETYGKDMLRTVANTANKIADEAADHRIQEAVSREINPLKSKLEDAEAKLQQAQQDKFWEHLRAAVPNWIGINKDERFHNWLGEPDAFTGYTKQQLLTSAEQALDANRVVAIFNAFLKSIPASQVPTPEELQRKVVPEPVGSTAQATTATAEVASVYRNEITKFYKDKAIGKYKNRPQEAEQMEKRIQAAIKSGNVY